MTNLQESRLSMYLTARDYQTQYATITNALPNFGVNFTVLQNTITQIQAIAEMQKLDKTGITQQKSQLRQTLIKLVVDNSRKLTAFAKFTNNLTLLAEVKYSESTLQHQADTALRDYAQIMHDRAQTNIDALAPYGITPDTQRALLETIAAYNESLSKPKVGIIERSQATQQMAVLFKTADSALTNMDLAVEIIRSAEPNYYNGYKASRKVAGTGVGFLALKGQVADAASGEPLKGVTITFAPQNGTAHLKAASNGNGNGTVAAQLTKKSADKGGFNVKTLAPGMYTVTVSKNGYADQQVTVAVSNGEMSEVHIALSKN